MKRECKIFSLVIISGLIGILLLSFVSAGMLDWVKETLTGKATSVPFHLNITVGGPQIITVQNMSETGVTINEGPLSSLAIINFTVHIPVGVENLNLSTALVNLTRTNEDTRTNVSCKNIAFSGNSANFTCSITMWWWDNNGTWSITAFIRDNASNGVTNTTATQYVGEQKAIKGGPAILTWPGLSPGSWNSTSNNHPLLINNSGNIETGNITINSTHLRGETTNTEVITAENFSISWATGGTPSYECNNTARMRHGLYTQVAVSNLTNGNYTLNDGITGQERLYFCLINLASNLSTQAYSSGQEGNWVTDGWYTG